MDVLEQTVGGRGVQYRGLRKILRMAIVMTVGLFIYQRVKPIDAYLLHDPLQHFHCYYISFSKVTLEWLLGIGDALHGH